MEPKKAIYKLVLFLCYCLPLPVLASDALNQQFNEFYAAEKAHQTAKAQHILKSILKQYPKSQRALLSMGYLQMQQKQPRKASDAFASAYANSPSAKLALQTGYAKAAAGEGLAAFAYFGKALQTNNAKIYAKACQSSVYASPYLQNPLPAPWYTSLYLAPFYESRISDVIYPVKLRLGKYLDSTHSFSGYSYFHLSDDTRSSTGEIPQIYNDNYASIGAGVDWYPFSNHSLRIFAETGAAFSLLNGKRNLWRDDTTVGAEGYWSWGAVAGCGLSPRWPLTEFGDLYASAAYYSRYHDGIAQWNIREGVRLFRDRLSTVSAFAVISGVMDTNDVYYNNILEVGPGLSWRPDRQFPLDFRSEYLFGQYFRGVSGGLAKEYRTWILEAIINF